MAKAITRVVGLQLPAGKATPAPPVGTVLGPTGINIPDFCSQFNEKTREMGDTIVPAKISIYEDRTFTFILKSAPAAFLLKKAAGVKSGSKKPHIDKVGVISQSQLEEIAETKKDDLSGLDMDARVKIIAGTARSMGIKIEG
ncbi:MAG: 50S ribosomal protein L11 [Candidatus Peregrinibacteria bacterium]